jgi:hypothetical protein
VKDGFPSDTAVASQDSQASAPLRPKMSDVASEYPSTIPLTLHVRDAVLMQIDTSVGLCVALSFGAVSRALGFCWTLNCDENESEITRRCV